jgi:membrane protein implicated in regulation of membrane protease activity
MNWWGDNPWAAWLGLAAALGVAEMFSLDLVLIMLAVGALAGALTAAFTDSVVAQLLVAAAASVAMLAVVRPNLARRLHGGPELRLGTSKLIGMQSITGETLTTHVPGRIKIDGEMWTAKPYDESLTIPAGTTVEVFEIRGATAYVHPIHSIEG